MAARACACEGHTLDRMLQPTVMALLALVGAVDEVEMPSPEVHPTAASAIDTMRMPRRTRAAYVGAMPLLLCSPLES